MVDVAPLIGIVAIVAGLAYVVIESQKNRLTTATAWFTLCTIPFINVGFIVAYFELPNDRDAISTGIIVVSLGLSSFVLTAVIRNMYSRAVENRYASSQLIKRFFPREKQDSLLYVVALVMFVPSWLYFVLLGYVPLFEGVGAIRSEGLGGIGALQQSRLSRDAYLSSAASRVPLQGLFEIARNIGVPIVASLAVAQLNTGFAKRPRIVVFILSTVTVLLAGQRWPLLYLIIAVLTAFLITAGRDQVSRIVPLGVGLGVIGIAISVLQGRSAQGASTWAEAVELGITNLLHRVVYEQSYTPILSYVMGTYGEAELLGRSYVESALAYLPGPATSFPVEFYREVNRDPHAFTAAPDFFTEAFINFGWIGVILLSAFWAIILGSVDRTELPIDGLLNISLRSGMVAVLGLSCFSGVAFTISVFILIVIILLVVRISIGKPEVMQSTSACAGSKPVHGSPVP